MLAHDVTPQADGSIEVGSSSDALRVYRLVGSTCECQDFTRGQAPEGWCQHRIAAGIAKRVQELLPQAAVSQSTPVETAPGPALQPLPEAPASVNVRLTIDGRDCQLTLRDSDETRLLTRLAAVLAPYPLPQPAPQASSTAEGWCGKHSVPMTQTTKDGRSWWSHKTDQGWCKGK